MANLVKKTQIVPFINIGTSAVENYKRIKKSAVFQIEMNSVSETYDFISSNAPREELTTYEPSLAQSLTMFKNEPDYGAVFEKLYKTAIFGQAHAEVLLVFYQEAGTRTDNASTVYKAWKVDSTVQINNLNSVGYVIDFDLSFRKPLKGAVSKTAQGITFNVGKWKGNEFTPFIFYHYVNESGSEYINHEQYIYAANSYVQE